MKKFTKVCLIICLVFLVASAVCAGVGVAMGSGVDELRQMVRDGEFSLNGRTYYNSTRAHVDKIEETESSSTPSSKERQTSSDAFGGTFLADTVSSLDVEIKYGKVKFIDGNTDQIEVSIEAPGDFVYACEVRNGVLELIDKTETNLRVLPDDVNINIAIPAGKVFQEVDISTNAGEMELSHAFTAESIDVELDAGSLVAQSMNASGEVDISVNAGKVQVDNLNASNSDVSCEVGEVKIFGKIEGDISAECQMGRISMDLEGSVTDYNYEVSCGVGEIKINGERYSSYLKQYHSQDGRHYDDDDDHDEDYYTNNGAAWDMELDCGIGGIDVNYR